MRKDTLLTDSDWRCDSNWRFDSNWRDSNWRDSGYTGGEV